jgi:hypothetical protein
MKRISGILIVAVLMSISCGQGWNLLDAVILPDSDDDFIINTYEYTYAWRKMKNPSFLVFVIIEGTLINKSGSPLLSLVSDINGIVLPELTTEIFDKDSSSWITFDLPDPLAPAVGGAMIVKTDTTYTFRKAIGRHIDEVNTGKFRLRFEYYTQQGPQWDAEPYKDYSNVFEIR